MDEVESPREDEEDEETPSQAWHALDVWQTLHPVPVHPSSQEQSDAVKLANAPDRWVVIDLCAPSNIVPPQAMSEHESPPNPTGQAQDEPFWTP